MKGAMVLLGLILSVRLGAQDPSMVGYNGFLVIQLFEKQPPANELTGVGIFDVELD